MSSVDAMGHRVREAVVRSELAAVFETDRNLGTPQRVRVLRREPGAPLPVE